MGASFFKGFFNELGDQVNSAEKNRLLDQRTRANSLKDQNLATLKGQLDEKKAATEREFKSSESTKGIKSREKIARVKEVGTTARAEDRKMQEAHKFASSLFINPESEPGKYNRAIDLFMTGEMPAGEVEPEEKGWWQKLKEFTGIGGSQPPEATASELPVPTTASADMELPKTSPVSTAPVSAPTSMSSAVKPAGPEKGVAPQAHINALMKNKDNPKVIADFKRKYGYLPGGL